MEGLRRGVKLADVALEHPGPRTISVDGDGEIPLKVVASEIPAADSWRRWACLRRPAHRHPSPTADAGRPASSTRSSYSFTEPEKAVVLRHPALAIRGVSHRGHRGRPPHRGRGSRVHERAAARCAAPWRPPDPTVLLSPDGTTRVQLAPCSRTTTKDILREGLQGDYLFILPASLFEGRTNYADIEVPFSLPLLFLRRRARARASSAPPGNGTSFTGCSPSPCSASSIRLRPAPPSFEKLAEAYGVGSRETYHFLRTAHELHAARRDGGPESPLLGVDAYVEILHPRRRGDRHPVAVGAGASGALRARLRRSHRPAGRPIEREESPGSGRRRGGSGPSPPSSAAPPVRRAPGAGPGSRLQANEPRLRRAW